MSFPGQTLKTCTTSLSLTDNHLSTDLVTRTISQFLSTAIAILGAALAMIAVLSLQWRFQHDTALLFYISFLIERFGYIPYRDIFDVNLPATYFTYGAIGRLTDYSELGVRLADLTLLGGLMWMTWRWMKEFGRHAAWAGAVVFGLVYLRLGPAVSLQREFLILLPVVGGIVVFARLKNHGPVVRSALTGLLFGVAALIKPQAILGFPVLLIFEFIERRSEFRSVLVQAILPAVGGFFVPILIFLTYLSRNDALEPFYSIISQYYPLYSQLTGEQSTLAEGEKAGYLLGGYFQFGGFGWWLIPGAAGLFIAFWNGLPDPRKRQAVLLLALVIVYSLYPLLAGKFWHYHWLLFAFFSIQLGSVCVADQPVSSSLIRRLTPAAVFLAFAFFAAAPSSFLLDQIRTGSIQPIKGGRVDAIAEFLRPRLQEGETVQTLDWTGGAAHALLQAKVKPATRFVYDVMFYHHSKGTYTQGLRREFATQLQLSRPRFIVEVFSEDKPWVKGKNTTMEFPELRSLISSEYMPVSMGNGYTIHERRTPSK